MRFGLQSCHARCCCNCTWNQRLHWKQLTLSSQVDIVVKMTAGFLISDDEIMSEMLRWSQSSLITATAFTLASQYYATTVYLHGCHSFPCETRDKQLFAKTDRSWKISVRVPVDLKLNDDEPMLSFWLKSLLCLVPHTQGSYGQCVHVN